MPGIIKTGKARAALLILAGLLAALFAYRYYHSAFPELTPDFSLNKGDVKKVAAGYARDLGFDPTAYLTAQTFQENTQDKFFLELEYGLDRLREDVKQGVCLWHWRVRHFIPGQQEEFSIDLDTGGRLVGFSHQISETTSRPELGQEEARQKAEDFLARYVRQHPLDRLELIETGSSEKPGYLSHSFTWKRTDLKWGEGIYHLHVRVDGDRVGGYSEHLDEPESWSRDFAGQRSVNELYGTIAGLASVLLGIGGLALFLHIMLKNSHLWRLFPLRWAIPFGLVFLGAVVNRFPELLASYPTTANFSAFIAGNIGSHVFNALGSLAMFVILAFVADILWQQAVPEQVSIRALLTGRGLATRQAQRSVGLGFVLALVSLAYITAYYMLGRQIGIWAPASIDQSKILTGYFPALESLSVGLSAAWNEEFLYRVIGLVTVYRLTGSKWLAIVVSGAAWGFMHSGYPQMPGFARGLELTLEGMLLGWVALRYGILTTFLSHCLFNTWLGAFIVWRTGSPVQMAMAAAVSFWPALIWLYGRLVLRRNGRYYGIGELIAAGRPLVEQLQETGTILAATHRIPRRSLLVKVGAVAAVVWAVLMLVPETPLSDLGAVRITPGRAEEKADSFLKNRTGLDPDSFTTTVSRYAWLNQGDPDYLLEQRDGGSLARLLRRWGYEDYWAVRYFQPEEVETYTVVTGADGKPLFLSRTISEEKPGPQLDRDQALKVAEDFLQRYLDLEPDQLHLVSSHMNQLPARRDHSFTFRSTDWQVGESQLRWFVTVQGDRANSITTRVRLPEEYRRHKNALDWSKTMNSLLGRLSFLLGAGGIVVLLVVLLKGRYFYWRQGLKLGCIGPALGAVGLINAIPDVFQGYETTLTLRNYVGTWLLHSLLPLVLGYAYLVLLFAVLIGLIRWVTGCSTTEALLGASRRDASNRFVQGVGLALLGVALLWGVRLLEPAASLLISEKALLAWDTFHPAGFSTGLNVLLKVMRESMFTVLHQGILVLILILLSRKHRGLLFLVICLLLLGKINVDWSGGFETLLTVSWDILTTLLELWILLRLFRFNAYGYLVFYFYLNLLPAAVLITEKGWPAYGYDIALLWTAAGLPLLAALVFWRRRSPLPAGEGAAGPE